MHSALKDKTNEQHKTPMKKSITPNDKDTVVNYLKDITNKTKDYDLKYDLNKCVEILEGKENQDYKELKGALEEILLEKEMLFKEKCELAVELDYLKSKKEKIKRN